MRHKLLGNQYYVGRHQRKRPKQRSNFDASQCYRVDTDFYTPLSPDLIGGLPRFMAGLCYEETPEQAGGQTIKYKALS